MRIIRSCVIPICSSLIGWMVLAECILFLLFHMSSVAPQIELQSMGPLVKKRAGRLGILAIAIRTVIGTKRLIKIGLSPSRRLGDRRGFKGERGGTRVDGSPTHALHASISPMSQGCPHSMPSVSVLHAQPQRSQAQISQTSAANTALLTARRSKILTISA